MIISTHIFSIKMFIKKIVYLNIKKYYWYLLMNNQLNISNDTLSEIIQYLKFNDLINIGLTNKNNYDKIFIDPSFIMSTYKLSLIVSEKTFKFFEKINKKIFVKNLIIIIKCSNTNMIMNFLQTILPKYEINFLEILKIKTYFYIQDIHLEFILKLFVDDKKKNLKELHLESCKNINENELKYLSKLNKLVKLIFSCNITNNGLKILSELNNLVELDLSNCKKITNDGLLSLSKLCNLN